MQAEEAASGSVNNVSRVHHRYATGYQKVLDGRKRRVRGLWQRNGAFYAQMEVEVPGGGTAARRIRLEKDGVPVPTVAQAVEVMNALKVARSSEGTLSLAMILPHDVDDAPAAKAPEGNVRQADAPEEAR